MWGAGDALPGAGVFGQSDRMADFINIAAKITRPTTWVELPELPWPGAAVEILHDSTANHGMRNARMLRQLESGVTTDEMKRLATKGAEGDAASLAGDAASMRVLLHLEHLELTIARDHYPEHIVVGWRNVLDVDNVEVPYTVEDCRKVFAQFVDHAEFLIVRICAAARNPALFGLKPAAAEASLGNS